MEELRVLLVESHATLRKAIAEVITSLPGVRLVAEVEDGREVISIASQRKSDVILLDITLAGLSGLEVTRLVKQELPQIPVVILLDEEDEDYKKAVEQCGAGGYLVKSRITEELPSLLEKLRESEKGGCHAQGDYST